VQQEELTENFPILVSHSVHEAGIAPAFDSRHIPPFQGFPLGDSRQTLSYTATVYNTNHLTTVVFSYKYQIIFRMEMLQTEICLNLNPVFRLDIRAKSTPISAQFVRFEADTS